MTTRAEVLELASEAEAILPSVAVVLREYAALLSSVEDGEGIVRELQERHLQFHADGGLSVEWQAAARITLDAQEKAALKAELASVKAHAEAMWVQCMNSDRLSAKEIAHSYRAAFPKEPSNG